MKNPVEIQALRQPEPLHSSIKSCRMVHTDMDHFCHQYVRIRADQSTYLIVTSFHDSCQPPRIRLVGPRARFKEIDRCGRKQSLVIELQTTGMYSLLPFPLSEIRDTSVLLTEFMNIQEASENLPDQLASDPQECITALADLFWSPIGSRPKYLHPAVRDAIAIIRQFNGRLSVAAVARKVSIGERYLRKLMQAQCGLGPKQFSRIERVLHTARQAEDGLHANWAGLAVQQGYYDQAHMIDEFQELLGFSPERYRKIRMRMA